MKPMEGKLVVALEQAVAAPLCTSRLADAASFPWDANLALSNENLQKHSADIPNGHVLNAMNPVVHVSWRPNICLCGQERELRCPIFSRRCLR